MYPIHVRSRIYVLVVLLILAVLSCSLFPIGGQNSLKATLSALQTQVGPGTLATGPGEAGPAWSFPPEGILSPGTKGEMILFTSQQENNSFQVNSDIYVVDVNGGGSINLTDHWAWDDSPAWSPDGKRIAFWSDRDGNPEIYLMDIDGGNLTRLTNDPDWDINPCWSPDGKRIAFVSGRDGGDLEIYAMNADGSGLVRLTDNKVEDDYPTWSPDGSRIAFQSGDGLEMYRITLVSAGGGPQSELTYGFGRPAWSPDGKQIAYLSSKEPNPDLFVINADGGDPVRLTQYPGMDSFPVWSPDGKAIIFESGRGSGPLFTHELYLLSIKGPLENADESWVGRLTTGGAQQAAWSSKGGKTRKAASVQEKITYPTDLPADLTVCPSGCAYSSIQAAVNAASPGQVIEVLSGRYAENVKVDKSLILRGKDSGAGSPVLDPGKQGRAFWLAADRISLSNFQVAEAGSQVFEDGAIYVTSNHNSILNNLVANCRHAIMLNHASFNAIRGNTVSGCQHGIMVYSGSYNQITGNTARDNQERGIAIETVEGIQPGETWHDTVARANLVSENTAQGNLFGLILDKHVRETRLVSNHAIGNRNAGIFVNCGPSLDTIEGNLVEQNQTYGIVMNTAGSSNMFLNNQSRANQYGLSVERSSSQMLVGNRVSENSIYGMYAGPVIGSAPAAVPPAMQPPALATAVAPPAVAPPVVAPASGGGMLVQALFWNWGLGLPLDGSYLRRYQVSPGDPTPSGIIYMYKNTLTGNATNAFDAFNLPTLPQGWKQNAEYLVNHWDNGQMGNYYSDYSASCVDANADGICDVAYPIPGGTSLDHYPLKQVPAP